MKWCVIYHQPNVYMAFKIKVLTNKYKKSKMNTYFHSRGSTYVDQIQTGSHVPKYMTKI